MARHKLGDAGYALYCSSAIENFKEKFARRFKIEKWSFYNPFKVAVFFGMYNVIDYLKFLLSPKVAIVFWCGSDIKQLNKRYFWRWILPFHKAKHICENSVEQKALEKMNIYAKIVPCLVDKLDLEINFEQKSIPEVYLTLHPERGREYGLEFIEEKLAPLVPDVIFHIFGIDGLSENNIVYHGQAPEEVFNEKIKCYQAALRLNCFDGFSEVLAKSALMGQYPISAISYPHITHTPTLKILIKALNELKNKKKPNYEASEYWKKELSKSLEEIINL